MQELYRNFGVDVSESSALEVLDEVDDESDDDSRDKENGKGGPVAEAGDDPTRVLAAHMSFMQAGLGKLSHSPVSGDDKQPTGTVKHDGVVMPTLTPAPADAVPMVLTATEKSDENADEVLLSEHPSYDKYFKMLKMNVPKPAVQHRMKKDGVNPAALDMDANASYVSVKAKLESSDSSSSSSDKTPSMKSVMFEGIAKGAASFKGPNATSKLQSASIKGHIQSRRFVC